MMEDIAAIQSRISEIQNRISTLSGSTTQSGNNPAAPSQADGRNSFENVLSQQQQSPRFGLAAAPNASTAQPYVPPASLGSLPIPMGRRPILPSDSPETVAPVTPTEEEIAPIQASGVSQYEPIIDRYAAANGLPPSLVRAVIKTESDGNPRSVSRAGAMGLMQLMPDNVREAGIDDPFDPEQNIAAGSKQLAGLLDEFHGNLDLALAGYNAGPGNVMKYGGVPPFPETQDYIKKVRAAMTDGN